MMKTARHFLMTGLMVGLWAGSPSSVWAQEDPSAPAAPQSQSDSSAQATAPRPVEKHGSWSFKEVGLIPIQSGGRLKPLDSYAREVALFVTGSRKFQGWEAIDLILSWISNPREWDQKPIVQIMRPDVRRQLGLDEKRSRFSPAELIHQSHLGQYSNLASQPPEPGVKPHPREQELKRVLDRIGLYRAVVTGEAWSVLPQPAPQPWKSLAGKDEEGAEIRAAFAEMVLAYRSGDETSFQKSGAVARLAVQSKVPNWSEKQENLLAAESLYNRSHPFLYAWILYLLAAIAWVAVILLPQSKKLKPAALALTVAGVGVQIFGIAIRCYIAGRPPVTNMYESVIWVGFGVMFFGLVLYALNRQAILLAVANAVAMVTLIVADSSPAVMDPSIHPLVPVLRSNYWLTIHVLTITLSYAAFALCLGIANVTMYHFLKEGPGSTSKIENLNQLTYRAMQFGVVLLAAGTILGGVWADYSWGRFWGWDPKEVWALAALMGYLIILHARFTGWVRQFGFAAWTIVGFLLVVMAWYGVNFVLGVGLHSYGFSSGGQGWVAIFSLLQLAWVGTVAGVRKRRGLKTTKASAAAAPTR